jgi:hypothetical protein
MSTVDRTMADMGISRTDRAETVLRTVDNTTSRRVGVSFFHILALLSIFASIALFMSGKRMEAIFIGLWPPTFEALKSAAEKK